MKSAHTVIQEHYGLDRRVTDKEVDAEIAMLKRRGFANLDDGLRRLYYALQQHCGLEVPMWGERP